MKKINLLFQRQKNRYLNPQSYNKPKKQSELYFKIRKKRLEKYTAQKARFNKLTDDMLISEHVYLKSFLEFQKLTFSILVVGVFLSIISGIWANIYRLLTDLLTSSMQDRGSDTFAYLPMVIFLFLALLAFIILCILMFGINSIKSNYRDILVIEEIRKKRKI
ncbi:hypothetical protein RyT2_13960 [Pseudolactococcus yaeyamensis]